MGLEVYYPSDILNALAAAEQAATATATALGNTNEPFPAGFLAGYRGALTTLALAFGLAAREGPQIATVWAGVSALSQGTVRSWER